MIVIQKRKNLRTKLKADGLKDIALIDQEAAVLNYTTVEKWDLLTDGVTQEC